MSSASALKILAGCSCWKELSRLVPALKEAVVIANDFTPISQHSVTPRILDRKYVRTYVYVHKFINNKIDAK